MTENISGIGRGVSSTTETRSSDAEKPGPERTGSTSGQPLADSHELTPSSRLLQQIADRVAQGETVDAGRVESVRAAIAEGSFSVDAERVASRLLDFENLLKTD